MSELNSTNAWPFTEIPAEEGLDINAIFGDSTDTANQGNPFEVQATFGQVVFYKFHERM